MSLQLCSGQAPSKVEWIINDNGRGFPGINLRLHFLGKYVTKRFVFNNIKLTDTGRNRFKESVWRIICEIRNGCNKMEK